MPVYFIRSGADGLVKIGWSNNVDNRCRMLQTGHPKPLGVIRVIEGRPETERWLHMRFAERRMIGEWFEFHPDMLTIDPPEFGPSIPETPSKRPSKKATWRRQERLSWEMCWPGNPCQECRNDPRSPLGVWRDLRAETEAFLAAGRK